jgi:acetyl esterase/lipase
MEGEMKKMLLAMAGLLLIVGAVIIALYLYSPAGLLNRADRMVSRSPTKRIASDVAYGSDPRQKLDVYATPARDATLRPVLVFFYGGGWANGERGDYDFVARAYGWEGFIVVIPDYRHVPQVRFPGFLEDSANSVKWVQNNITRLGGDPERISVAGHSAGAYNALMLALDPQWLGDRPVRAAVSLAGPADFHPFTTRRSIDAMSQWPDPTATQPVSHVRANAPPILLMHGTGDTVVRIRNAISLEAKQRAAGGRITLRQFEGASHNDLIMAVSRIFRSRLPVLVDSARFMRDNSQPIEETGNAQQGR